MKKKVYKAYDLDGTWCAFTELESALEFIKLEEENLELEEDEAFELVIKVEMV